MDIIIASSRGEGLETELKKHHPSPNHVKVIFSSGARINNIKYTAMSIAKQNPHQNIHFYVLGGYCDVSERISYHIKTGHSSKKYEEFVFEEDPESAVPRVSGLIDDASRLMNTTNTTPVFCTIAPSYLHTWNKIRLSQHQTCMLKHNDQQYQDMQKNMIYSIVEINKHIVRTNISNNMHTPKLADVVIRKKGKGRGYRLFADKFRDGVHPTDDTRERWAELILSAIKINRTPSPSMALSKRPAASHSDSGSECEHDSSKSKKRSKFNTERKKF